MTTSSTSLVLAWLQSHSWTYWVEAGRAETEGCHVLNRSNLGDIVTPTAIVNPVPSEPNQTELLSRSLTSSGKNRSKESIWVPGTWPNRCPFHCWRQVWLQITSSYLDTPALLLQSCQATSKLLFTALSNTLKHFIYTSALWGKYYLHISDEET